MTKKTSGKNKEKNSVLINGGSTNLSEFAYLKEKSIGWNLVEVILTKNNDQTNLCTSMVTYNIGRTKAVKFLIPHFRNLGSLMCHDVLIEKHGGQYGCFSTKKRHFSDVRWSRTGSI